MLKVINASIPATSSAVVDTATRTLTQATAQAVPTQMPCINVSSMEVTTVATNSSTETPGLFDNYFPDAFLYIVVVLSFYAFAMVVLMVKYIRRENQEAELSFYFTEFIKRDKFQCPMYQNKQNVDYTKKALESFYKPLEFRESAV